MIRKKNPSTTNSINKSIVNNVHKNVFFPHLLMKKNS